MKAVKYIIIFMLVCVGVILPGELYQNYVGLFSIEPNTSFYMQEGISRDDMLDEILSRAEEYDVSLFFIETRTRDNFFQEIKIYCDDYIKKYIENKYDVYEGKRKSLFSDESQVDFYGWNELTVESMKNNPDGYYVVGTIEEAREFKLTLIDKYGGNVAAIANPDGKTEAIIITIVAWIIIISIVVLINYYEVVKLKKEMTIRMTMGQSLTRIAIKSIITDVILYILILLLVICGVRKYEGGLFLSKILIWVSILLVVINVLVSCTILFTDYKKAFSNVGVEKRVLKVSYILKILSTIMLIVAISGNVVDSVAYVEALSQKDLYKHYDGYSYINIYSDDPMEWWQYSCYFYEEYVDDKDIVVYEWIVQENDYNIIMANANFKWYLEERIEEFSQINEEYKKYVFIPESYRGTEKESELSFWDMYLSDGSGNTEKKVIYYKGNINIPAQNSYTNPYTYLNNPVIMYSSQTDFTELLETGDYIIPEITLNRYFVDISTEEMERIVEETGLKINCVDVYEKYQYELLVLKRIFVCNLAVMLMMFLIEMILIFTIVRMEYIANRKAIIIKKVLGYSVYGRFKDLYRATLVTGVICVSTVIIVSKMMKLKYGILIIGLSLLLLFLEILGITMLCVYNDKTNIQRTLKNGF